MLNNQFIIPKMGQYIKEQTNKSLEKYLRAPNNELSICIPNYYQCITFAVFGFLVGYKFSKLI